MNELTPVIHDRLDSFMALVRLNDESYIYAIIILTKQFFFITNFIHVELNEFE